MRPRRESARNNEYVYFVSTQTTGRTPFFRHERWARLMIATLDHYAITDYVLHAYVVMPDHLHVLITPSVSVGKSIGLIKGGFSFRAKRELDWKGEIWQPGFTDHRIRDEADWEHHIEYIRLNPVRAKMAEDSVLYPYMNFPNARFPRGLKPQFSGEVDVRAEARTLQTEALQTEALQTETSTLQTEALQTETSTLQTEARTRQPGVRIEPLDSVKGTGFSPSVEASQSRGALAPEGGRR
jgi:putative transposase